MIGLGAWLMADSSKRDEERQRRLDVYARARNDLMELDEVATLIEKPKKRQFILESQSFKLVYKY